MNGFPIRVAISHSGTCHARVLASQRPLVAGQAGGSVCDGVSVPRLVSFSTGLGPFTRASGFQRAHELAPGPVNRLYGPHPHPLASDSPLEMRPRE